MNNLTEEQKRIVNHPLGQHARILAVAGSGKTTTMVRRISHLVINLGIDPRTIKVLMFNNLARQEFSAKLNATLLDPHLRPDVQTFHSLAYRLLRAGTKRGTRSDHYSLWIGDKEELARSHVRAAITDVRRERGGVSGINDIDPKEALHAISLWKASLIKPACAGHKTTPEMADIYARFEQYRLRKGALTFDDFVPEACDLIRTNGDIQQQLASHLKHLIVDEYQDINYGQQQLVRLLAGDSADVMIVGDDDQTIYEWRAARPYYIREGFSKDFGRKQTVDYFLSRSFRFGPKLAQCAENVIAFNTSRHAKSLVAHQATQLTEISVISNRSEQHHDESQELANEIESLVLEQKVPPNSMVVLGRTFAQTEPLQSCLLMRGIPFRVLGMASFFEREENKILADYVRIGLSLDSPFITVGRGSHQGLLSEGSATDLFDATIGVFLAVANRPYRRLSRDLLKQGLARALKAGFTIGESVEYLAADQECGFSLEGRNVLRELLDRFRWIQESADAGMLVGPLLKNLVTTLGYREEHTSYYGTDQPSEDRLSSIENFILFATASKMQPEEFLQHLESLDSALGYAHSEIITVTTIHRTKGLEFDYVFLPQCTDGNMPGNIASEIPVFDKSGRVPHQAGSPLIEAERRLFYVAITRAKRHCFIGTIQPPDRGLQLASSSPIPSRFIEEMQLAETTSTLENAHSGHWRLAPSVDRPVANIQSRVDALLSSGSLQTTDTIEKWPIGQHTGAAFCPNCRIDLSRTNVAIPPSILVQQQLIRRPNRLRPGGVTYRKESELSPP
ncbi:MAG TPA: ATP-dependent helicase [Bryobacteraceae bacterium]|jgi:DNA helicase-2/ATP-dependent DNA helicase PcrA|nr:ATP-dependent helicase [Bryobacteraceae bacterium]